MLLYCGDLISLTTPLGQFIYMTKIAIVMSKIIFPTTLQTYTTAKLYFMYEKKIKQWVS